MLSKAILIAAAPLALAACATNQGVRARAARRAGNDRAGGPSWSTRRFHQ